MLDAAALPRGADDCLSLETFVITGVLPHLSRCAR
jgi:BRCT domain type II-containing protein